VRRRAGCLLPAVMEKEHLAHKGVIAIGLVVSTAFGTIELSRILVLIIATGLATKVTLVGGSVTTNRSAMSRNASEYMLVGKSPAGVEQRAVVVGTIALPSTPSTTKHP